MSKDFIFIMVGEGSGSLEKCLMYVDIEALGEEVVPLTNMPIASISLNPLSFNQKRHKKPIDPNVPLHEYVVKSRAIGSMFYI